MSWEDFTSGSDDLAQNSRDESQNSIQAATTPQYTITNSTLFNIAWGDQPSTVPCLWVESGISRLMTYDSSGRIHGDGRLMAKRPIVCMKAGPWITAIQQALGDGTSLDKIEINRWTTSMGKIPVQTTTYFNAVITIFKQKADIIVFSFSYTKITDIYTAMTADGADTGGNYAVTIDYERFETKQGS